MSRIGKKPIIIPVNVSVKVDGQDVLIKGPKGEMKRTVRPEIKVEVKDNRILVSPQIETKKTKAFWGLTRMLLANMVEGVNKGFERKLEIKGVGFKAGLEDDCLILHLGFSHPVKVKKPDGIDFIVKKNFITVSGIDIEKVSQTAAKIRRIKPPEPYKGKGIRYEGEIIRRKVGKKASSGSK